MDRKLSFPKELDELLLIGLNRNSVLARQYGYTEKQIGNRKRQLKKERAGKDNKPLLEDNFIFDCF